jgi:hypothetical protein
LNIDFGRLCCDNPALQQNILDSTGDAIAPHEKPQGTVFQFDNRPQEECCARSGCKRRTWAGAQTVSFINAHQRASGMQLGVQNDNSVYRDCCSGRVVFYDPLHCAILFPA